MLIKKKYTTLLLSALSIVFGVGQCLAAAPNIGDALQGVKLPEAAKPVPKKRIEVNGLPIVKKHIEAGDTRTLFVKTIQINGATKIGLDELNALLAPYENRDLTYAQIVAAVDAITQEYREQGYLVARCYLPVQNIKNDIASNTLTFEILEGGFDKIILENSSLVKDYVLQKVLDTATKSVVIYGPDLEEAIYITNDIPGVKITSTSIEPGATVGTSSVKIIAEEDERVGGYVIADNHGSRYTGEYRLFAGIHVNSIFGLGDQLNLAGLTSDKGKIFNGRISYSLPLMANGLVSEIGYTNTTYTLIEEYEALDAVGDAHIFDLNFTLPIFKTRSSDLKASLYLAYKNLSDEIGSTNTDVDKTMYVADASLEYKKQYPLAGIYHSSTITGGLTVGNLSFDDKDQEELDRAGADTEGMFSKLWFEASNVSHFTEKFYLETGLFAQYSLGNKNLDGSEKFYIGGSDRVRFFPSGEESGDTGFVINLEAKYILPTIGEVNNTVGVFYDIGYAESADNFDDAIFHTYQDLGASWSLAYNSFFMNASLAIPLASTEVTSVPDYDCKGLVQVGYVF